MNQANLTDWYPFIVPYSNGWILHDTWNLGEHLVYDASDFEVNVKMVDAGITFAASGVAETNGEWTRYRLLGGRTFALSASDKYLMVIQLWGASIRAYYFPGYEAKGWQSLMRRCARWACSSRCSGRIRMEA